MHRDDSPIDDVIDKLAADLRPVRPQRAGTGWALYALAIAVTALGVHAAFGLKPGFAFAPEGRWVLVGGLVLTALGVACAWAAIGMASPQRSGRPGAFWVVAAAAVMPLTALALSVAAGADMHEPARGYVHWSCAGWGALSATLVLVTLAGWLRRGAPAAPSRAGLYAGLAVGASGSAVYGLSCPIPHFDHWAIWHFVPVAVGALVGRWLLPRLLRW